MERYIVCRDLELRERMSYVRLHFWETVRGEDGKLKGIPFHEDFLLDDWKVKEPLPEKYDKEGNLIHQNPVFLSGHFRGHVVNGIAGALAKTYYPGRNPAAVLTAFMRFNICANKLYRDKLIDIEPNIDKVEKATAKLKETIHGIEYSADSLRFYQTTHSIMAGFGRGELDQEDGESDE